MSKLRRRSFALVEVLVATSLFVMLLIAIFGIFWRTAKVNQSINNLRVVNEQVLLAQARLQDIFARSDFYDAPNAYFFIEKAKSSNFASLVFTFDNRPHVNHNFSNNVVGKLYVENETLYLATWPHHLAVKWPPTLMRKEALLEQVTDFHIELFLAPQPKDEEPTEEETKHPPPEGRWVTVWQKEYAQSATFVKLTISKQGAENLEMFFFIPNEITPILYDMV